MREDLLLLIIGGLMVGLSIIGYGIYNMVPMNPILSTLMRIGLFLGFGIGFTFVGLGFAGARAGRVATPLIKPLGNTQGCYYQ